MKIIRQKLFAKGIMGQLKKLESLSRGLERAKKEAIEKGINPNSSDLVNKWRIKYVNAQGALLDKGVSNPDKVKVKVKHTKTVPLKDRTVRLTREERLAKWDPSKQYNHNNSGSSSESLINKDSVRNKIESKRPGIIERYDKNIESSIIDNINKEGKKSFLDKKLKEAESNLSSKDKRILRKTIINEAKKTHIKPGNIKSSLANDKDAINYLKSITKDKNELKNSIELHNNIYQDGLGYSTFFPKKSNNLEKTLNGEKINKNIIKKVQYGNYPKYSFTTLHEINHLKNVQKGLLDKDLINKEHFSNTVGRSMKGNLGKVYNKFSKYQEDLYNQDINYFKLLRNHFSK